MVWLHASSVQSHWFSASRWLAPLRSIGTTSSWPSSPSTWRGCFTAEFCLCFIFFLLAPSPAGALIPGYQRQTANILNPEASIVSGWTLSLVFRKLNKTQSVWTILQPATAGQRWLLFRTFREAIVGVAGLCSCTDIRLHLCHAWLMVFAWIPFSQLTNQWEILFLVPLSNSAFCLSTRDHHIRLACPALAWPILA